MRTLIAVTLVFTAGCKKDEAAPKVEAPKAEAPAAAPAAPAAPAPAAAGDCTKGTAGPYCIKLPAGFAQDKTGAATGLGVETVYKNKETFDSIKVYVRTAADGYDNDIKMLPKTIDAEHFETLGQGPTWLHFKNKGDQSQTIKAYYKGAKSSYFCLVDGINKDHVKPEIIDACKTLKVE